MISPDSPFYSIGSFVPPGITALIGFFAVWFCNWFFLKRRRGLRDDYKTLRQTLVIGISVVALIVVFLLLPVSQGTRGHMMQLLGIVLTGVIALSSTTFVSNAMAGLMLRLVRNFRTGDFIRVNDQFGRVTERGLLSTEIQTEDRDLTTFPNLHLITNPVTVIRTSGTIISAEVSLGYDIPQKRVQDALMLAATQAGLSEAFVQVTELGDFSVGYKISGFLDDIKTLLTSRSRLKGCMLDSLHEADIEIVSPNFMNQRIQAEGIRVLPPKQRSIPEKKKENAAEELMFDKADEAENVENLEIQLKELKKVIHDKKELKEGIEREQRQLEALEKKLEIAHEEET